MSDSVDLSIVETSVRLIASIILGGLVGFERERRGRAAGLRTHIMVALGAASFTSIAVEWIDVLGEASGTPRLEPLRVVATIVGGVGFLGAGAIIQSGQNVRGLTTAAGIWVVASIGVACGAGFYVIAGLVAGLSFVTLTVVKRLEPQGDSEDSSS